MSLLEDDDIWLSLLEKSNKTRREYKEHPERFPFHVVSIISYSELRVLRYGITDFPKEFGEARDEYHHVCTIPVEDYLDERLAGQLAVQVRDLLNKVYGKEV